MSDARTDGTCKQSLQVQVLEIIASEIAYHGTSDEGPTAILAALAEAGLEIRKSVDLTKHYSWCCLVDTKCNCGGREGSE